MDITFKTRKLANICNSQKECERHFGIGRAKRLTRRLDDLRAAICLEDISRLPPARCHELTGNRSGQLSIDLDHPYRLIFVVANDPIPVRTDGGLDWSKVTAVQVLGVEDTHG